MKRSLVLLVLVYAVFAHQPRIVEGSGIVEITNPQISQAFYGELNGSPAVFEIKSDAPFELYVGITVPAIEGARIDKSVEVTSLDAGGKEKRILFLNASGEWRPFHEEFAGDDYFQGPETRMNASAGTYRITVSSPGNAGKYALAVGEEEVFGPGETINAVVLLPKLKSWFFGKSPFEALFTKVYLFAFLPVFAIVAVLALGTWAIRTFILRKPAKIGRKRGSRA